MSRNLTSGMTAAVSADVAAPILLVEALFDSGPVRVWSDVGTLTWAGLPWIGVGTLLGVSAVEETQELRATGASFTLSGIPSELLALALDEDYQGRPVRMLFGLLDGSGVVIGDPVQIFGGRCDVMTIDEGAETASIEITAESRLIDLERPRERRYTPEDQALAYPGDKGLDYVASIQDLEITWGRG